MSLPFSILESALLLSFRRGEPVCPPSKPASHRKVPHPVALAALSLISKPMSEDSFEHHHLLTGAFVSKGHGGLP